MTQYIIKPLVWKGDGSNWITSDRNFEIQPIRDGVTLISTDLHRSHHTRSTRFYQDLEEAKARAQEIWNDYLKQYLEPVSKLSHEVKMLIASVPKEFNPWEYHKKTFKNLGITEDDVKKYLEELK